MRVVFMGTPSFAVTPLERLYSEGHDIACVVTQPDKPRGRGMKPGASPVKELAIERGTPVYQPESLRDNEVYEFLRAQRCELIVVVAYGKKLPRRILDLPPNGCINIHGSLLPKYRGAAPVQWAVLNGEKETGVTSMFMEEEIDAGDIILSEKISIGDNETAGRMYERLGVLGADILNRTIDEITQDSVIRKPQNSDDATFAPPISKDMSPIDWTKTGYAIKCKVRGLNPQPVATMDLNGAIIKVFTVDINSIISADKPGSIVSAGKDGIGVACADGTVIIKELQAPGGKRMTAGEYLRGHMLRISGRS